MGANTGTKHTQQQQQEIHQQKETTHTRGKTLTNSHKEKHTHKATC